MLRLPNLATLRLTSPFDDRPPETLQVPPPEVAAQRPRRDQEPTGAAAGLRPGLPRRGQAADRRRARGGQDLAGQEDPGPGLHASIAAEASTEGIDVLPGGSRRRSGCATADSERLLQRDFRVNIWDFGGQEIYHATHQFFLTKRSVYVLVSDERKEDTDFQYWLEIVEPAQRRQPAAHRAEPQAGPEPRHRPRRAAAALPQPASARSPSTSPTTPGSMTRSPDPPASWSRCRTSAPRCPRTWQRRADGARGATRGTTSPPTEFFADLRRTRASPATRTCASSAATCTTSGICLFFQDDPLLRKTVILKPDVGHGRGLPGPRRPGDHRAPGVFTDDDLAPDLARAELRSRCAHELLRLMERFGLCYPGARLDHVDRTAAALARRSRSTRWDRRRQPRCCATSTTSCRRASSGG